MPPLRPHFRSRSALLLVAATAAAWVAWLRPAPPARTLEGLADMLSRASGARVAPGDVAWGPPRGLVRDALLGRGVLFLARAGADGLRDVFSARVRVSAEGHPVAARAIRAVTDTPFGDETGLELRGDAAVFATVAFGRVQGVTALQGVGTHRRPAVAHLVFGRPARSARMLLAPPRLDVELEEPAERVALDLAAVSLRSEAGAASTVRLSRPGPDAHGSRLRGAAARWVAAGSRFTLDVGRRTFAALFSWSARSRPRQAPVAALGAGSAGAPRETWPPPPVPSLWESPDPGEGQWEAGARGASPGSSLVESAPPYLYTTTIRPDPQRPYAKAFLVALDMRQLELALEAGYAIPAPRVGPPGPGRIPEDVRSRGVAAFGGAGVPDPGGDYGLLTAGRLVVPPRPDSATILVTEGGGAGFWTWDASTEPPAGVTSFRQLPGPLLDVSRQRSSGAPRSSGSPLSELPRERAALGITPSRQVYYAWSKDLHREGLARALELLGCEYGVELRGLPRETGFALLERTASKGAAPEWRPASPEMSLDPGRFFSGARGDFFYLLARPRVPVDLEWTASPGALPPPSWMPGILETRRELGALAVRLLAFEPGRVDWIVRAGTEEPSAPGRRPKKVSLDEAQLARALAAIGLGHTTDALRYGLVFGGEPSLDLRRTYATVVFTPGAPPELRDPGDKAEVGADADAVQLPLLADGAELDAGGGDRGAMRVRGALCVTPRGRTLVAIARHDSSDPLVSTLTEAGCRRIVGLDRGSRQPAFVHRAGTAEAPAARYGESVVYAIGRPMTPNAFRGAKF